MLHTMIALFILSAPLCAQDAPPAFRSTDYPLPRFVSLVSDEVSVRTGPGFRYPVKWTLQQERLPVEIILEYDNWRKIRDHEGDTGWVHQSLLSGRRTALVSIADAPTAALYKKKDVQSPALALLEPFVIVTLDRCEARWCFAAVQGHKGWIEKTALWGVYEAEKFD